MGRNDVSPGHGIVIMTVHGVYGVYGINFFIPERVLQCELSKVGII